LSRNIGRAKLQIQCERDNRHNQNCNANGALPPRIRPGAGLFWNGTFSVDGSEQSTRYFNARRFGFRIADQSGRAIAIDLLELVLINKPIAARASIARLSSKRPKNRKKCRSGHHGKNDPKCHYAKRLSFSAKALVRKGPSAQRPTISLAGAFMIAPHARLHHGANTAAMGVRARQFRNVAVDFPQKPLSAEKLRARTPIVASRRKPRPRAYSKH
jgi:hypothetical protein